MKLEVDQIKSILASRNFAQLIGAIETEQVDFKDQPYQLSTATQRYAFLEDIISFANQDGGLIVLGARTIRSNFEGDEVSEIRLIPEDKLPFEEYRQMCNRDLHPLVNISFDFYAEDHTSCGLAAISIPKASSAQWPHLIAHTISDAERKITTKYGLTIRTGARNFSYSVQSLHATIQTGSAVSSIQSRIEGIENKLETLANRSNPFRKTAELSTQRNISVLKSHLPSFLTEVEMSSKPTLILATCPSMKLDVNEIYDKTSSVSRAFDEPPELREGGFGMDTGSRQSELLHGRYRRVAIPGYKARELSRTGVLLASFPADEDFLAWATNRKPGIPIRYRSYVLAEVTFVFAQLIRNVIDSLSVKPNELDLFCGLRNCYVDSKPPLLSVAYDHGQFYHSRIDPKPAPKINLHRFERVSASTRTERLAFLIRALLYRRFGFTDELIPYSKVDVDGRFTAADEILSPTAR